VQTGFDAAALLKTPEEKAAEQQAERQRLAMETLGPEAMRQGRQQQ
jgi:hypothetical protein